MCVFSSRLLENVAELQGLEKFKVGLSEKIARFETEAIEKEVFRN